MITYNQLMINGKSTADFPFPIFVEELPGLSMAKKKDKLFETDYQNGYVKQSVSAWESLSLVFKFYLHNVSRSQLREFKKLFVNEGTLVRYDDSDMHYNYLSVNLESEPIAETFGYEVTATFVCEPFEYEQEKEIVVTNKIVNHTNAPMHPLIKVKGNTQAETTLTIGKTTMVFKEGIDTLVEIECKDGYQNVRDKSGRLINNKIKGDFFEILPGESVVTKGAGITEVKLLARWGWV